jgi:hypothetical protein
MTKNENEYKTELLNQLRDEKRKHERELYKKRSEKGINKKIKPKELHQKRGPKPKSLDGKKMELNQSSNVKKSGS